MAAIKKRALAEYQSQVAVEDKETSSPDTKRLKLALRSEIFLGSHWSSDHITVLSLVQSFIHRVATPALLYHKDTARDTQRP